MAEYIERDALLKKAIEERRFVFQMEDLINNEVVFQTVYKDLAEFILSVPSADVAPVVHGVWLARARKNGVGKCCSACLSAFTFAPTNYCPNCGARMDGE